MSDAAHPQPEPTRQRLPDASATLDDSAGEYPIGTPVAPAFARRRGLFIGLLILYVAWMGLLIGLSIQQHAR